MKEEKAHDQKRFKYSLQRGGGGGGVKEEKAHDQKHFKYSLQRGGGGGGEGVSERVYVFSIF